MWTLTVLPFAGLPLWLLHIPGVTGGAVRCCPEAVHAAREAVGRIVSRDTMALDETAVARAAVESTLEMAPRRCSGAGAPGHPGSPFRGSPDCQGLRFRLPGAESGWQRLDSALRALTGPAARKVSGATA